MVSLGSLRQFNPLMTPGLKWHEDTERRIVLSPKGPRRTPWQPGDLDPDDPHTIITLLVGNQHFRLHMPDRKPLPNNATNTLSIPPDTSAEKPSRLERLARMRLKTGIQSLPTELQDMVLDLVLAASMPKKLHLQALPGSRKSKGYFVAPTAEKSTPPAIVPHIGCKHTAGAFRLRRFDEHGALEHEFLLDATLRKDCIAVIGPDYKPPLALQINRDLRDIWAHKLYEGHLFWFDSAYVEGYEKWVRSINEEHFHFVEVVVGWV